MHSINEIVEKFEDFTREQSIETFAYHVEWSGAGDNEKAFKEETFPIKSCLSTVHLNQLAKLENLISKTISFLHSKWIHSNSNSISKHAN